MTRTRVSVRRALEVLELFLDVRCVAAPVYSHKGKMVAAMSISVPIMRMNARRQDELATLVRRGAEDLSHRLGYGMTKLNMHVA